jgi:hypothetical protein
MWIEVFRTGTFKNSAGVENTWTEKDLEEIVSKYDPSKFEAPIVIGHPADNAPAYGWVEALKREGKSLFAKIKPTVQEFIDNVRNGLYKKVSISLYPDRSLRHIGFLGGAAPALKDLPIVQFKEGEYSEEIMDFHAGTLNKLGMSHASSLIQDGKVDMESSWSFDVDDRNRLLGDPPDWKEYGKWFLAIDPGFDPETKEYYKYPFGKEGKVFRSALTAIRQRAGQQEANEIYEEAGKLLEKIDSRGREQEEMMEKKFDELEEKVKTLTSQHNEYIEANKKKDKELQDLKAELAKTKADLRKAEYEAFCDELMGQGKLIPAQKKVVLDFMEILHGQGEYEFSEGGKKSSLEAFKEFLTKLPKQIEFSEFASKGKARPLATEDKREELISEYMEKHKADYKEAVLAVSKKHPELFREAS